MVYSKSVLIPDTGIYRMVSGRKVRIYFRPSYYFQRVTEWKVASFSRADFEKNLSLALLGRQLRGTIAEGHLGKVSYFLRMIQYPNRN